MKYLVKQALGVRAHGNGILAGSVCNRFFPFGSFLYYTEKRGEYLLKREYSKTSTSERREKLNLTCNSHLFICACEFRPNKIALVVVVRCNQ